jgi:hypothetical protein
MNDSQKKVFDMYRKNTLEPKIYTYDQLLERAEKIVNRKELRNQPSEIVAIEDIPF